MDYDREGKPCRACTDFSSWMKIGAKSQQNKTGKSSKKSDDNKDKAVEEQSNKSNKPCPPDVNEIGRSSWTLLHTISVYLPENELSVQQQSDASQFMSILSRSYPCTYCAEDLRQDLKDDPPKVRTGREFSQWLCQLHNKVNVKLGKPEFDCSQVYERWRDGYKDGSCD